MYEVKTTKSLQAATEALIEKLKERELVYCIKLILKKKLNLKG